MSSDKTENQSPDDIRKSRDLSLGPQRPPSQVPGYTIQQFLGSGAYGEVWAATNQKTGRKVAIKFYTRRSSSDIQLLAQEVEKLVVLAADRYVVQLLDVGWEANPPYYVMDYIEHGSLEDRLTRTKPLPAAEAVELFTEVATGMMHLHGKGVLHCDLKPGNVLLDQDGKPRVADFGQSRLSTEETSALGTLFYMAPEQADMDAVPDAKWDVYGLGALLFSMLTGKPPYYSKDLATTIEETSEITERLETYRNQLQSAPKPTAHRKVPGVDRKLADIIDKCVAANPKDRFPSVQSVLFALRQREASRARRPLVVLGVLGPLMLLSVMSLFGWWAFQQSVGDTETEIVRRAKESNHFAARFAARSAAEQIDEYFRVVRQLAKDPEFIEAFEAFDQEYQTDPILQEIRESLSDPRRNNTTVDDPEIIAHRQKLIDLQSRRRLRPFLEKRMYNIDGEFPKAASWFINDRAGTQISSVFPSGEMSRTLGMNWAFRTYFSGLDRDLDSDAVATTIDSRKIIDKPHICAIFLSKASNTWKIAFSSPIKIHGQVRGVLAATAEVGDFVDFTEEAHQYAMLVDDRVGDNKGAVLEHPLFDRFKQNSERIPESLTRCSVELSAVDADVFFDPIGKDPSGESYKQESLAAHAPVEVKSLEPQSDSSAPDDDSNQQGTVVKRKETGLHVVVIEDLNLVVAPARDLAIRLGYLAALAGGFFILVAFFMWILVARMLWESRRRLDRTFSPASESSILESMETIGAPILSSQTMDHPAAPRSGNE